MRAGKAGRRAARSPSPQVLSGVDELILEAFKETNSLLRTSVPFYQSNSHPRVGQTEVRASTSLHKSQDACKHPDHRLLLEQLTFVTGDLVFVIVATMDIIANGCCNR
jgi:hypothetical protein